MTEREQRIAALTADIRSIRAELNRLKALDFYADVADAIDAAAEQSRPISISCIKAEWDALNPGTAVYLSQEGARALAAIIRAESDKT